MTLTKLRQIVIAATLLSSILLVAQGGSGSKGAQMKPAADVQGPHGSLRIKGISGRDSVFLNGTSQEFLVGSVGGLKNGILLPPGQQHVIIVDPQGDRQVYSAYVTIVPNQRATLRVDKSSIAYEKWTGGGGEPMYSAPTVSPTLVQPVSVQVSANPAMADCGQLVHVVWNSNGYNTLLKLDGVAVGHGGGKGEVVVDPKQTTTYLLEVFGPGGVATSPVTVRVNNAVKTSLSTNPTVVRYHKVGDAIVDSGTATLNWSATNAQSVKLEPFGPVTGTSGEKDITFTPSNTGFGPVDETEKYTITATNDCGGSDTSTALVQVAGSIDPPVPPDVLPPKLPQTGSPLPLIGLIGLGSLTASFVLRKVRKS